MTGRPWFALFLLLTATSAAADPFPAALAPGRQIPRGMASDGRGGAIVVWEDNRNPNATYDIYARRISSHDSALWVPNGVPICKADGDQLGPQVIADGSGGWFIAWSDLRGTSQPDIPSDIYMQHINSAGKPLWAINGIKLGGTGDEADVKLVPDGAGGAIACWDSWASDQQSAAIVAQHVDVHGTPLWGPAGVTLCQAPRLRYMFDLCSDGAGGAIAEWDDQREFTFPPLVNLDHVYGQRVDATGAVRWAANGIQIDAETHVGQMRIVQDAAGGALFLWMGHQDGYDILARHVTAAGAAAPIFAVCTAPGDQSLDAVDSAIPDGNGGTFVVWRGDNIFAQHLNASDSPMWGANGALVTTAPGGIWSGVATDGSGGAWVTWQYNNQGVYAQHVDASGTRVGGATTVSSSQFAGYPWMISNGSGGIIVAFWDLISGYQDIYASIVRPPALTRAWDQPAISEAAPQATMFGIRTIAPNAVRDAGSVDFFLPKAATARLAIHDLQGRMVRVLRDGVSPAGLNHVDFGIGALGGALPSGIYMLELSSENVSVTRRLVVVR